MRPPLPEGVLILVSLTLVRFSHRLSAISSQPSRATLSDPERMFLTHRPTIEEVQAFLAASRQLPLSYDPVGLANTDASGFRLDISETVRWLGYQPSYSLARLLSELAAYGDSGPPRFNG